MTVWFVWRWRGSCSGWRVDSWDPDDPVGYPTLAEAQARVLQLMASYRKSRGRSLYPPPIAWTERPRMKPRKKEQRHTFSAAELDGWTYRRQPVPESHQWHQGER
jgi:hypothetical protein